ncbi:MAG: RsmB/NOP family class I SAM-dependent RNA methyltransferase [Kineosporiaceae bacterium]
MTPAPRTRNAARRALDPARRVAFEVLRAVDAEDSYANLVLPRLLRRAGLTGRDAAFATELAYGALRGRGAYDAVLAACVDRPLDQLDPPVLDALRLGAHQLLAMRVPAHAGVSATVDVVRAEIGQGAAGFANAVLRRVAERDLPGWLETVIPPDAGEDTRLAVVTSHPVWIVRAFRDALAFAGRETGELPALLAADNAAPAVTLAALPGLADAAELAAGQGTLGALAPTAVRLPGPPDALPAVRQGRARVQDEGSQLVSLALAAALLHGDDGGRWLDLCAGPGGKTALLGAVLAGRERPGGAVLVANEVSPHRAELVRRSVAAVERAAPGLIDVRVSDGRTVGEAEPGRYDRVLVDAPCTGLGALRRRPEARWRRTPADLATLGPLQRDLLRSALDAVRPGGVVAYVTCSPHPAETRLVVDDVLRGREDVERLDARAAVVTVAEGREHDLGDGPDVQLWPHVHGTDAMYLALLRRRF